MLSRAVLVVTCVCVLGSCDVHCAICIETVTVFSIALFWEDVEGSGQRYGTSFSCCFSWLLLWHSYASPLPTGLPGLSQQESIIGEPSLFVKDVPLTEPAIMKMMSRVMRKTTP